MAGALQDNPDSACSPPPIAGKQLKCQKRRMVPRLTAWAGSWQDAMLLTTVKFVAFLWFGTLAAGITLLAVLYLVDLLVRVIRQRFPRRR